MTALLLALGGVAGALCRYHSGRLAQRRYGSFYPVGTYVVNLSGCLLLGLLTSLLTRHPSWPARELALLFGVGFCGAYTTFSSFALETVQLWLNAKRGYALFNLLSQPFLGVLAASAGLWLGFWLP